MVHALQEVWRVLVHRGSLIDLRPLAINLPIEVVAGGEVLSSGVIDGSPGVPDDVASEAALRQVISDGYFVCEHMESFECALYWDTIEEMWADAGNWRRWKLPAESTLVEVRQLMARTTGEARVRVRHRMVITRYRRVP
jgi:hypothetical protein